MPNTKHREHTPAAFFKNMGDRSPEDDQYVRVLLEIGEIQELRTIVRVIQPCIVGLVEKFSDRDELIDQLTEYFAFQILRPKEVV